MVDALFLIHKAGIKHNDFSERNVVIMKQESDGEYWPTIIDFGESQEHQCGYPGKDIPIYCPTPSKRSFGCLELWNACHHGNVWKPRTIS